MSALAALVLLLVPAVAQAATDDPRRAALDANYLQALQALKKELGSKAPLNLYAEISRMKAGTEAPTPKTKGKLADLQATYEASKAALAAPAPAAPDPAPPAADGWPTSVAIGAAIEVEVVREDAEAGVFVYRTKHFEFECDARLRVVLIREFGRIFEATFAAVNAVPLGLDCQPPAEGYFKTRLFTRRQDYIAAGGPATSAGVFIYRGGKGVILIPLSSLGVTRVGKGFSVNYRTSNPTLVHEITHQVMVSWLPKLPAWFVEGMADYFAAAPYNKGRFRFTNPGGAMEAFLARRRGVRDGSFRMLKPEKLFAVTSQQWLGGGILNYASADAAITFFLHLDDGEDGAHVRDYLAAVRAGTPPAAAAYEHLLRGRDAATLESEMATAWRRKGVKLGFR